MEKTDQHMFTEMFYNGKSCYYTSAKSLYDLLKDKKVNKEAVLREYELFEPIFKDLDNAKFFKEGEVIRDHNSDDIFYLLSFTTILFALLSIILLFFVEITNKIMFHFNITDSVISFNSIMIIILFTFIFAVFSGLNYLKDSLRARHSYVEINLSKQSKKRLQFLDIVIDTLKDPSSYDDKIVLKKLLENPKDLKQAIKLYQTNQDTKFWKRQIFNLGINFNVYRDLNKNRKAKTKDPEKPDFKKSYEYEALQDRLSDVKSIVLNMQSEIESEMEIPLDLKQTLTNQEWDSLDEIKTVNKNLDSLMLQYWQNELNISKKDFLNSVTNIITSKKLSQ